MSTTELVEKIKLLPKKERNRLIQFVEQLDAARKRQRRGAGRPNRQSDMLDHPTTARRTFGMIRSDAATVHRVLAEDLDGLE